MLKIGKDGLQTSSGQAAVRWFLRQRQGQLTGDEKSDYQTWLSLPENTSAFERVEGIWGAAGQLADRPEIDQLRQAGLSREKSGRYGVLAIAAGLVLCLAGGLVFLDRPQQPTAATGHETVAQRTLAAPDAAPEARNFATAIGERSTVTLRDGSVLTLNTNSAARVSYTAQERKIFLSKGQALFEVAKGQKRPFVVYAGGQRIVATGTAFDVRLRKARVEVTMVEGHVVVDQAESAANLHPGKLLKLEAGERLIAKAGEPPAVATANVDRVTSWTSGRLVFLDTRLADAVDEANRYTQTTIRVDDPALSELRINGVFRAGQPAEFARAVAEIYPVSVEYQPDGSITIAGKPLQ